MLVYGQDELVQKWVSEKLGGFNWKDCKAIGITDENSLIAGIVYHNYIEHGKPIMIEMSIASVDRSWCNRNNLRALFVYPFTQLNVKRVQAVTSLTNYRAREFLERLGFVYEGIAREACPLGGDATVYSMLKPECTWIK